MIKDQPINYDLALLSGSGFTTLSIVLSSKKGIANDYPVLDAVCTNQRAGGRLPVQRLMDGDYFRMACVHAGNLTDMRDSTGPAEVRGI